MTQHPDLLRMNNKNKIKREVSKRKWGKRLTNAESINLYSLLGFEENFDLMPERWQEILEQLAIGVRFRDYWDMD